MLSLYKNVRSYYYREVQRTPIAALVAAEIVSILGSRMTYLALPWFVLVTTGSAAKMSVVLAVEIAADGHLRDPERDGGRAARRAHDDARLRRGPGAAAGGAADPPRRRRPALPAPARARLPARLLHGALLRSAARDPAGARRRGRDDDRAGEQRRRGRHRLRRACRPGARRDPDPVPRRAERPLRRRGDLRRLVRPPGRPRPAPKPIAAGRCGTACSQGSASSSATGCSGRSASP